MICGRCDREVWSFTGSYFNRDWICHDCEAKERAHPAYLEAVRVECEAVRAGDFNFPGVGLPPELEVKP